MEAYFSSPILYLLLFLAGAAIIDLRTHRIPNLMTVSAAVVGVMLNVASAGTAGAWSSGLGLIVGLVAFLPFYAARGFGAGDVKAMGAVGAFLGAKGALFAAALTLMVGALGALFLFTTLGLRTARAHGIASWRFRELRQHRFPYGVAIACGTALSLVWS